MSAALPSNASARSGFGLGEPDGALRGDGSHTGGFAEDQVALILNVTSSGSHAPL